MRLRKRRDLTYVTVNSYWDSGRTGSNLQPRR